MGWDAYTTDGVNNDGGGGGGGIMNGLIHTHTHIYHSGVLGRLRRRARRTDIATAKAWKDQQMAGEIALLVDGWIDGWMLGWHRAAGLDFYCVTGRLSWLR
jgi:hypothetical protein